MRYVSTRGDAPVLGFDDVTLAGLALDGGLYVPEKMPVLDMAALVGKSYHETAVAVLAPFMAGSVLAGELPDIVAQAYREFEGDDVAPLYQLEEGHDLLELFHGPTLAFKDVALQFLGQVFSRLLAKKQQRVTIVGATSGDTGSAAIHAFADKPNVDIFILHPKGRVSDVQRRQMTTVQATNVYNIVLAGDFDDCQDLVKAMFNDAPFRAQINLSAVNSINWARIAAQVVYYVYASLRVKVRTGKEAAFVVPTGNFGNIYAGYIAKQLGAPIARLIAATNRNDILFRFFATGQMKRDGVTPSLSPSMDIQVSSNFERLLFELFNRQGRAVAETMNHFQKQGPFQIDTAVMENLRKTFGSGRIDDEQTVSIIRDVNAKTGYVLDPHTAVGVGVAQQYRARYPDQPVVTLATAHAAKFPQAVERAIGRAAPLPTALADLMTRPERATDLPNDLLQVQDFIRTHAAK